MKPHLFARVMLVFAIIAVSLLAAAPVFADRAEDERIAAINKRNAELGYDWVAGHTSVSGLSAAEKKQLLGLLPLPEGKGPKTPPLTAPAGMTFDRAFDWRQHNGVTPVTNQRSCGSCWAFAAVAQLESHTLIYDLRLEDLSEQQTIDCNPWGGGCGGGWVAGALELFMNPGCVAEVCYPYEARDGETCRQAQCPVISMIADYNSVQNSVNAIKTALLTGPVSTAFTVIDDFYDYTTGCYQGQTTSPINHAMLIVGWDDDACSGQGAWIVKNSWGPGWGQQGFAYIKYGSCNIGSYAYQITYLPSTILVHLTSPNGGDVWNVDTEPGSHHTITWYTSRQIPDSLSILLSLDGGADYDRTVAHGLVGVSSYDWTVPDLPVATARIKVVAYFGGIVAGFDASDSDFMIKGRPYRYVKKSGGNIFPYSLPEWAARKIQDAVSAAVPGDTIIVAGDTYNLAVTAEEAVYLYGGWNSSFTERNPSLYPTRLRTPGSAVSFMSVSSGPCGIEGFIIEHSSGTFAQVPGNGIYGGAVFSYQSSPVIRNNTIDSCGVADVLNFSGGGAIACYGGAAVIEGNTITDCTAQCGGGIYLYQSDATIRGNRISGCRSNEEYNGSRHGGGLYALHSTVALEGNRIENNDGYRKGSGIYLYLSPGSSVRDTIALNDGLDTGAGIAAERSPLTISDAVIRQNTATSFGGGIWQRSAQILMTNCVVSQNHSNIIGGGFYADSCWGGVTNNTFDRNDAKYAGGNVYIGTTPSITLRNNLITYGVKNGFQTASLNVAFQFNDCFGNTPADVSTPSPVDSTNSTADPLYADTTASDYHLLVHSPGIDAGDPAGPADPDGSRADLGAFGGPDAVMAAPAYVRNLAASAVNDTTISLSWDELGAGETAYAVYGCASAGFAPRDSVFLGFVSAPGSSFLHRPIAGCRSYRVSAVNGAGYGGGYSNEARACSAETDLIPPEVAVVYPNGGELLVTGDTVLVDWTATDNVAVDSVSVLYSADAGRTYTLVASGWPGDSAYSWVVPSSLSDSCLVKVVAYDPGRLTGFDVSDSLFAIRDYTAVHGGDGDGGGGTPTYVTALEQNYPNPFNGTTTIGYSIGERCAVEIRIYDPAGRMIRVLERADRSPGRYSVLWNGKDGSGRGVASGVYFCRIKAGKYTDTRKVLYLR
jgi:C1A family cysteine protease